MQDDLISRQAAIEALWKALYDYEDRTEKQFMESDELDVGDWFQHRIFVQNMSDIDRQTILNLPSAQPDRKKGKWIYNQKRGTMKIWTCSECRWNDIGEFNFCSNCGADMRGENDGTD